MSMTPKQLHPVHHDILDRIGDACKQTAKNQSLNQFLCGLHRIRLMINDLHNDIVKGREGEG